MAVADRLAQGDLGVELSGRRGHGEAGRLLEAMRAMIENIRRILGRLVTTAERVAKRAELLRTTGQQISIGGENQSRATGTSFASMAEMTASIETVAGSTEDLTGRK
ncbi:MAG: methyl-accepting chemotaxis protein [bacterium]|nr:methyl-accepting chemotaxis protein [bacterium]